MPRDGPEAHRLEHLPERLRLARRVLDELDAVEAERIARDRRSARDRTFRSWSCLREQLLWRGGSGQGVNVAGKEPQEHRGHDDVARRTCRSPCTARTARRRGAASRRPRTADRRRRAATRAGTRADRSARASAARADARRGVVGDALVGALGAVAHPPREAPPTVLPAVATSIAGQNSSGLSLTSPKTTGSEPIGSSVAETNATTKTVLSPYCGRAKRGQQGRDPASIARMHTKRGRTPSGSTCPMLRTYARLSGSTRNRLPVAAASALATAGAITGTPGSPTPDGFGRRRHDVHLDGRHLVDAQERVVVEVRLLDHAVLQRDLAVQRRRQPEADAAFHLRANVVGVDRDAAIDGAHDAIDAELVVLVDRHLRDLRDHGAERLVHGDAAARASRPPCRQRAAASSRPSPRRG